MAEKSRSCASCLQTQQKLAERARVVLNALRHSHASALIAAGVDVLTISRRLGHGSPAFTLTVYGHLFSNTDAAAARAIDATFFTPSGARGAGLSRQSYGVTGYFERANNEVMLGLMIEDLRAIENLEEIIAFDAVDYFFIAPGDLSQSMGPDYAGKPHDPDVRAVIRDAIQAIVAAGRTAGTVVSDETVNEYLELGVRFLLYSPLPYLFSGAQRFRTTVHAYRGQEPELT